MVPNFQILEVLNREEIPVSNVVIECENGIVLSDNLILEDWENLFPADSSEHQLENFNKNIRDNDEICNINSKTVINMVDQIVLQGNITEVTRINSDKRNSVL